METGMEYEFKEFMENVYGDGAYEKHYVKGPQEEKERFERQYQALREKKIKEFMERVYGKGAYEKHYVNGPQEEKERFTTQYDALQEKAFKEFMEQTYGIGAYDKHYLKGPAEEKERFERQFFARQEKLRNEHDNQTAQNQQNSETDRTASSQREGGNKSTAEEAQTITTISQTNAPVADGAENTDNEHKDEPEWKKLRREAWEKYAEENRQEFKLLSEDKAPELNMSVGGTPVQYADEHNVTLGNGEYGKFLKAIEIEKQAKTDVINFGNIESEDYKSKLAAACLQLGMKMKNGPKSIDLSLDCFKNLDEETKAKIEEYNRKQAEQEQEKPREQKPVQETDKPNTEDNTAEPASEEPKDYKKLYEDKVAEMQAKKSNGESVDFAQIKDPVERLITYAAAKQNQMKIENLDNNKLLFDEKQQADRKEDVTAALEAMPEEARNHIDIHEKRVHKLREIKQLVADRKLRRGEYRDNNGNINNSLLRTHTNDGTEQHIERYRVEYEIDENGRKHYKHDEQTNAFILRQRRNNNGR